MIFGNWGDSRFFPVEYPELPPLQNIDRIQVLRTGGNQVTGEVLGAGFLRKNIYRDRVDWRYPNFVLVIVLQGSGKYVANGNSVYALHRGSAFIRLPNIEHSNFVDPQSGYLECYLEIGPQLYQALSSLKLLELTTPVNTLPEQYIESAAQKVWQLGWQLTHSPEENFSNCVTDMIKLLDEIKEKSFSENPGCKYQDLIDKACRELGKDFAKDFSVQKFCRKHAIGYENFRKLFKAGTGMSPWTYRIICKLESAAVMLRGENLTIKEIAGQLGYNNAYEFSAQFKKKFGISPGKYRNQR